MKGNQMKKFNKKEMVLYMKDHNKNEEQQKECSSCPSLHSCFLKCWIGDNYKEAKEVVYGLWSIWEDLEVEEQKRIDCLTTLIP